MLLEGTTNDVKTKGMHSIKDRQLFVNALRCPPFFATSFRSPNLPTNGASGWSLLAESAAQQALNENEY